MTLDATTISTPIGALSLLTRDDVIVAAGFATPETMAARMPDEPLVIHRDLGRPAAALTAYFDGELHALDDLPVSQPGGDFHQAAWKVMREVAPGETITYAELASRAGNPKAVRAAGSACARNLIAPIVPCHRIVRTGGALGGYYYGLSTKDWLLAHERG
ncbi:MAG TPA: methylated-DNA--[protein]-cysteine S-methyltransferase [Mycobacteriales bacterium]|jgi:methylated-DNA-[protein]-cysteine S-methyltransferase|nr:methylated-DNA--[protein]-cysteine S-methyltransferase [Mycobacteriales bacterium]